MPHNTDPLPFGDRLAAAVDAIGAPIAVGIDPHLPQLPAPLRARFEGLRGPEHRIAAATDDGSLAWGDNRDWLAGLDAETKRAATQSAVNAKNAGSAARRTSCIGHSAITRKPTIAANSSMPCRFIASIGPMRSLLPLIDTAITRPRQQSPTTLSMIQSSSLTCGREGPGTVVINAP